MMNQIYKTICLTLMIMFAAIQPSAQESNGNSVDEDRVPAAAETVDSLVTKIQELYDGASDYRASFHQAYRNEVLGDTRTSSGTVYFMKPGRMRWDYETPNQRYLISDGQMLWIYEPEFQQYYTQSLQDSELPAALRFLMGEGRLREDFAIRILEQGSEESRLELIPNVASSQYQKIQFLVRNENGQIRETLLFDALGNTNSLTFADMRVNQGLPVEGFRFEPPAGTSLIQAP